ncbi:MAG: hypothetical protein BWX63_02444 [Bacteroidetes bacterium ADurb.Bin041]|nr:MAG: hypothetical protein BWX63_02444 [Bacteroidetes bacterium ADurb.Bin041]
MSSLFFLIIDIKRESFSYIRKEKSKGIIKVFLN